MNFFKGMTDLKQKSGYFFNDPLIIERTNTDEGLKQAIEKFYRRNDRYPNRLEFQYKNELLPIDRIIEKYGNTNNMYEKIGIDIKEARKISSQKDMTLKYKEIFERPIDEEDIKIKNKVEKFYNKYNRYPTSSDCFDVRFIRYSTIQEKYVNLENMYKKLGFKYYNERYAEFRKSDELILEDLANIIRANNLKSWNQFFILNTYPPASAYKTRLKMQGFDIFNKALNIKKNKVSTKEDIIERFETIREKEGKKRITRADLKKHRMSLDLFRNSWGSYSNFIKEYDNIDIISPNSNHSTEFLIESYIKLSNILGKKYGATLKDIDKKGKNYKIPSISAYTKRFGSIENLRSKAGFKKLVLDKNFEIEMKKKIIDYYNTNNIYPSRKVSRNELHFPIREIEKKYGTLGKMYDVFGLEYRNCRVPKFKKDKNLILHDLCKIIISNNIQSRNQFIKLKIFPRIFSYQKHLKMSWSEIYFEAYKKPVKKETTKEEIIEKYHEIKKMLNKDPEEDYVRRKEIVKHGVKYTEIHKYFKKYKDLILEAESENEYIVSKFKDYTKEELIKLYIDFSDYLGKYNGASERDFQNHHKNFNIPTKEYFTKKFGTFGKLRIASGFSEFIEANRLGYRKYSRDQIIHLLYKKHKKYKRELTIKELSGEKGLPSLSTIHRRISHKQSEMWKIVFETKEPGKVYIPVKKSIRRYEYLYNDKELALKLLKDTVKEKNVSSWKEFNKMKINPALCTYKSIFNIKCSELYFLATGIKLFEKPTKQEIIEKYYEIKKEMNKQKLTLLEVESNGIKRNQIIKFWGSYTKMLNEIENGVKQ